MAICGVYAIRNVITGGCYVGSSKDIKQRWRKHIHNLRRGKGEHPLLNNAWLLYGERCFELVVLCKCGKDELLSEENKWLNRQPVYNFYMDSRSRGKRGWPPHNKGKKGFHHTLEVKQKMSLARKGMTSNMKGKLHSEETKLKMSASNKRRWEDRRLANPVT